MWAITWRSALFAACAFVMGLWVAWRLTPDYERIGFHCGRLLTAVALLKKHDIDLPMNADDHEVYRYCVARYGDGIPAPTRGNEQ